MRLLSLSKDLLSLVACYCHWKRVVSNIVSFSPVLHAAAGNQECILHFPVGATLAIAAETFSLHWGFLAAEMKPFAGGILSPITAALKYAALLVR